MTLLTTLQTVFPAFNDATHNELETVLSRIWKACMSNLDTEDEDFNRDEAYDDCVLQCVIEVLRHVSPNGFGGFVYEGLVRAHCNRSWFSTTIKNDADFLLLRKALVEL